ncbi:MAG: alpha/beta hydrolase [Gemmatimonadota bacterium]|nr:MAG: alpha/beta hydrolase [Gemmatimonadota bacterium]
MKETQSLVMVGARGPVSAVLVLPEDAKLLFVFGHGAGAGMRHPFMERVASELAQRSIATFRYQFPYMEAGRRSPDSPKVLEETVRAAISAGHEKAADLPLIAGGKSMGGRISSHIAADEPPSELSGLVFLGYPLHAPKKPDTKRAGHLGQIRIPMLFLQGTRDDLADLTLLKPIVEQLGSKATMHVVDGGNHSFKVLKRTGRTEDDVMVEITDTIVGWSQDLAR